MKDRSRPSDLKFTIANLKERLKAHYGMYVSIMTKKSSKEMFDYQQWHKTTIVNGDFINNLDNVKGLIKVKVWFEDVLLLCDIISSPPANRENLKK